MTTEHDDFWGDSADWPTAQHPIQPAPADPGQGRSRSRITGRHRLSGFLDRGTAPTREHRVVDDAPPADDAPPSAAGDDHPAPASYSYGDADDSFDWEFAQPESDRGQAAAAAGAAGAPPRSPSTEPPTAEWGEEWDVAEPPSRAAMIDPLLARIGAVIVAITLAVPVLLGFRSDSDPGETLREAQAETPPSELAAGPTPTTAAVTATEQQPSSSNEVAGSTSANAAVTSSGGSTSAETTTSEQATTAAATVETDSAAAASDEVDTSSTAGAVAAVDTCAAEYDVVDGDFWLRLAEGADVSLADLLAVNGATAETPLYPGTTICLPAGASTPPPPPATTAAPTTAAPTTAAPSTAAPTTAAPTTAAPTTAAPTTAAPTTAAPTTPTPTSPPITGSVEDIIRAVWPDELEERALEVAWRESNLQPDVRNYCCIGLFQIYWEVHRSWLSGMGITTLDHLYDAETNARAAYALYQRSGGWGPWGG